MKTYQNAIGIPLEKDEIEVLCICNTCRAKSWQKLKPLDEMLCDGCSDPKIIFHTINHHSGRAWPYRMIKDRDNKGVIPLHVSQQFDNDYGYEL